MRTERVDDFHRTPHPAFMSRFLICLSFVLGLACSRPIHAPRISEEQQAQRTERIVEALRKNGKPGDWLVRRGYHKTDDAISLVTNSPFSHAAVLDPERDQVIEADGKGGVHVTPIPVFAAACQRMWLMQPAWYTPECGQSAILKARALVGSKYDYAGLTGLNVNENYYCSELCFAIYRSWIPKGTLIPPVIPPGLMHDWATVLWDSGPCLP